jgi:FG-GAP-like repeat
MRWLKVGFGLLVVVTAAGIAAQSIKPPPADLVVHEWGTFLSMSGSDGIALDGMYHEEHALPGFVHARSRDQLHVRSVVLKGETPVIYFYTDRAQKARVEVKFPKGLWTQWYPQAQIVGPQFSQAKSPVGLRDGRIRWCAEIVPATSSAPSPALPLPQTASDALWNYSRDVDAAFVRTTDFTTGVERREYERFLFYRGLGEAPLPLRMTADAGGTLEAEAGAHKGVQRLFVIRVENGKGVYAYRPTLGAGERATGVIPSMENAKPIEEFTRALSDDLAARLVESGLYPKEARAMVNTWRTSYFHTEGVRALFVMPQTWTDAFIPLEVTPRPKSIVRVMVGRIELLSPEREQLAAKAVADLASPDSAVRTQAFAFLREQGRYVEPIVRRVMRTAKDRVLADRCRQLLAADFVTELRAAIHAAADGRRLEDDPIHIRAQLACLLREIGLDDEAKAEGRQVLDALRTRTPRPISDPEVRHELRAQARALEAVGDDKGAADGFAKFIRYASQVQGNKDCRFCHQDAGPRDMAWFKDWWAGEKYAVHTARADGMARAIAQQNAILEKDPSDISARMMLAYLQAANGEPAKAKALWAQIERSDAVAPVASRGGTIRRVSADVPSRGVSQPAFSAAPGSPFSLGPMTGRPAVGDVNGDGKLDIVASCGACCGQRPDPQSGHVTVLLGDGRGGFQSARPHTPIGPTVHKVALGDFDKDGRLDALAIEHDTYGVSVLLGDGRGGFHSAPGSPVLASQGRRPHTHDVAVGDVNGDGRLDAVTTNANDNNISVLLGDGKGGFVPAPGSPVAAGRHPYEGLTLRDLNADGRLDVVVANLKGNAVSVLLGDGKGGFAPAAGSPFRLGPRPGTLAVGDLNGDGRLDIVATHDDDPLVAVLLGDGKGGFAEAPGSPIRLKQTVWGAAIGDLNADGKNDVALGSNQAHGVVVLLGDGRGRLVPAAGSPIPAGKAPGSIALADVNGDRMLDVITGDYEGGTVSVLLGVSKASEATRDRSKRTEATAAN